MQIYEKHNAVANRNPIFPDPALPRAHVCHVNIVHLWQMLL